MADVETLLTSIIHKVEESSLPDTEKAEVYAALSVGMRRLVWPIVISHIPEYLLKEATSHDSLTMEEYTELITVSLSNPATPKEIQDEVIGALEEVETLLSTHISGLQNKTP